MSAPAGKLVAYRQAVIDAIKAWLPDMPRIEAHVGPLDVSDLSAITRKAPTVLVTIFGDSEARLRSSGEIDVDLRAAAFNITKRGKTIREDEAALNLSEAIAGRIACETFGGAACSVPAELTIRNHYRGPSGKQSWIALFSVEWRQSVRTGLDRARLRAEEAGIPEGAAFIPGELYVDGELIADLGEAGDE